MHSDQPPSRLPRTNELRDHLANERTFLAWIRTSITIIALGFVVAKFGILLREIGSKHVHPLTARAGAMVGVGLVVCGFLTAVLATQRLLSTRRNIENDVVDFSPTLDVALAAIIAGVSIVLAGYIVLTA